MPRLKILSIVEYGMPVSSENARTLLYFWSIRVFNSCSTGISFTAFAPSYNVVAENATTIYDNA
jgi:hypothetical protein